MEKFKVGDMVYIDEKKLDQEDWYKTFRQQYPSDQRVFVIRRKVSDYSFLINGDKHCFSFHEDWLVPSDEPVTQKPKTIRLSVEILKYANELMENRELDDTDRLNRLFGYIEATAREEWRG